MIHKDHVAFGQLSAKQRLTTLTQQQRLISVFHSTPNALASGGECGLWAQEEQEEKMRPLKHLQFKEEDPRMMLQSLKIMLRRPTDDASIVEAIWKLEEFDR